jgi:GT2 family glycosyltransferase
MNPHAVTTPSVSVCIANFNGEQMLADCIESVLAQDCHADIEIIVHDDASTDGSLALLRSRYPQVDLLVSEKNVGFCIANNRMVARARGQYVLLLNNDAALFPDALSTLLASAAEQKPLGILTLPQYDWISGMLVDRGCLLDPFFNPVPNLDPARRDVAYVIGACLWIPKDLWSEVGGFPEWMESIAEDLYLGCQVRLRGHPVQVAPHSGYRHRQGASFGGNRIESGRLQTTYRRRRLSERNKTRALIIMTPGLLMLPLLVAHCCALALEGCLLTLLRRDLALWRTVYAPAIATPFREFNALIGHRRAMQRTRAVSVREWFAVVSWQLRKVSMLVRFGLPSVT